MMKKWYQNMDQVEDAFFRRGYVRYMAYWDHCNMMGIRPRDF